MAWLLDNPERPYIDSSKTDVMRTWKRHGFVPPSEQQSRDRSMMDEIALQMEKRKAIQTWRKKGTPQCAAEPVTKS
jgi:hypothetical protein